MLEILVGAGVVAVFFGLLHAIGAGINYIILKRGMEIEDMLLPNYLVGATTLVFLGVISCMSILFWVTGRFMISFFAAL